MISIIKKVLQDQDINIDELTRLVNYVSKIELDKEPTSNELGIILKLFQIHQFNIDAIKQTILSNPFKYGLESIKIFDKDNNLIKFEVKEINN